MAAQNCIIQAEDGQWTLNVDVAIREGQSDPHRNQSTAANAVETALTNQHQLNFIHRVTIATSLQSGLDRDTLVTIARLCRRLTYIYFPEASFPISVLPLLNVNTLTLEVGKITIDDSCTAQRALDSLDCLGRVSKLVIRAPMGNMEIRELTALSVPGLYQIYLQGPMNDIDIERLKRKAELHTITISTDTFNTGQLGFWKSLRSVTISGARELVYQTDGYHRLDHLISLNVSEPAQQTSNVFNFLCGLSNVCAFTISPSRTLTLENVTASGLTPCLQHLNLSYTAVLVDSLLTFLRAKEIVLQSFEANNTPPTAGFTAGALSSYLEWDRNDKLFSLVLGGHTQLTNNTFTKGLASIAVLQFMNLRDCGRDIAKDIRHILHLRFALDTIAIPFLLIHVSSIDGIYPPITLAELVAANMWVQQA
jgi:hypothetical protein